MTSGTLSLELVQTPRNAQMATATTAADPCAAARQQFRRPLSADEQLAAVKSLLQPGDLRIKVAGVDIDGVLRGKVLSREKFLSAVKAGGFGIGDFS